MRRGEQEKRRRGDEIGRESINKYMEDPTRIEWLGEEEKEKRRIDLEREEEEQKKRRVQYKI